MAASCDRVAFVLALASSALVATSARGDEPDHVAGPAPAASSPLPAPRGVQLGARVGYALPAGRLGGTGGTSSSLSDLETAAIPVGVDAGYRLSPRLYVGGTAVWGPGTAPTAASPCSSSAVSCSRQEGQLRGEVRLYLAPEAKVGGWLAAGAGWEVASFGETVGGHTITATRTGFVLPDVELGFDVRRGATAVGLYFGLSVAMFLTQGLDPSSPPTSTWVGDPTVHTWMTFGLRGSYGPW
ncbi:MAG TPA: hypothetical protein VIF09_18025 [Polyangiaceae bacterium]